SQLRCPGLEGLQHGQRVVGRVVVHVDDLEGQAPAQGGGDLAHQRGDVVAFVVDRNYDGNLGLGHGAFGVRRTWTQGWGQAWFPKYSRHQCTTGGRPASIGVRGSYPKASAARRVSAMVSIMSPGCIGL